MSRLATSFVLGYHGCDRSIGEKAVIGEVSLLHSNRDFDWLGPGAYFWESDPRRALEWALWRRDRNECVSPYVIGAVIDLRNCLDLVSREGTWLLAKAFTGFAKLREQANLPMPENRSVPGQPNSDRILRYLDCAVIKHLHNMIEDRQAEFPGVEPFDTVRGMFTEGELVYPGSGMRERSHVQIAVRNDDCIRGVFVPRPYPVID